MARLRENALKRRSNGLPRPCWQKVCENGVPRYLWTYGLRVYNPPLRPRIGLSTNGSVV